MAKAAKKKSGEKKTGVKKRPSGSMREHGNIKSFPIVCIGGSAGGMEAFSEILENLSPSLGMAYVYIQHLSPGHQSLLPQILQRKSKMPVLQVKDNMILQANHVYVLPANFQVTVDDQRLKLHKRVKQDSLQSIDRLFTSVAPVYKQNAIGILLSGTGADGTLGLMAIKAEGGISFAQDGSAHFGAMPQHATEMGFVDFVMPPERIAKELASLIKHPYSVTTANNFLLENKTELQKIHMLMHNKRGVDFSHYKQTTIHRRILRRMALNRIKSVEAYVQLLREKDGEIDALYHDLLITVTNFFRDPTMFTALTNKVLPALLKDRRATDPLRIWIPGCATGEEAVSFAITLLEYLGEKALTIQVQIFATDLNEKAIEKARAGSYLKTALQNVSPQRLRKYFTKTNDHYQVIKSIRDMCIFASHNLLKNPPFSRMDIISCQNVLIYLESAPQTKIMHTFHYALKPTGFLILGKSETIGHAGSLFNQPYKQYKLYTKRPVNTPLQPNFSIANLTSVVPLPESHVHEAVINHKEPDLEKETDKLLLNRYTPASVLVNKDLEILRFRGSTSRYLEPSSGKASLNLLKMVREELVFDLRTVIHRAKKDGHPTHKEGIVLSNNGTSREITIEVTPIKGNGRESYYLIVFNDHHIAPVTVPKDKTVSKTSNAEKKISRLEAQLHEARESFKILTEDFEATREELQSANEEVLSSNEELQSINEELETSKEELQSTNEELTTINDELQIRNNELKEAGDYARAVIETMHESLLMLTDDLRVKNANKGFYQTFNCTPEKTEGVYLYDLGNHQWDIPELRKQLTMVQTKNIPVYNFEVTHNFPDIGIKSMLLNAHKFPLKEGNESMILLAVQDITDRKQMEETLKDSEERFRLLIQNASDIITVFDSDGVIKYESPAIETVLGYTPAERIGRNISMDPIVHPDDRQSKLGLLKSAIEHPGQNISGEFRMLHKNGGYRTIDAIFRNLLDHKKINGILATYRDITERKIFELQKDEFIGVASHELKTPVTSIKAYVQLLESMFIEAKDKKSAELLSKMNTQVDRLTTLIVDLLDFTRIEGGHLQFRHDSYSINDLINEVVEEIQRIDQQQQRIGKKLAKDVWITGDRFRTGQVLTNLLSNAIKYSPKDKKVIVSTKIENRNVIVSVQDFGIGIEQKMLEKVFDRFFRVTQTSLNTYPGLGLGLYIAAEFIKRQGGRIWATSGKNRGSTFFFSLPVNAKA